MRWRYNAAVVAYQVREELTVDGKPVTLNASDLSTWVRRSGGCAPRTRTRWPVIHTAAIGKFSYSSLTGKPRQRRLGFRDQSALACSRELIQLLRNRAYARPRALGATLPLLVVSPAPA